MTRTLYAVPLALLVVASATGSCVGGTTAEVARQCLPGVVLVTVYDENERPISSGSGFSVGDGRVVTAYHVVAGGVSASVKTSEKIVYPVSSVIAADESLDAAILLVSKATDLPPLVLSSATDLPLGEAVVAIGSPMGLEGTITEGIVSAVRQSEQYKTEVIQYSAPSSPGNSGGPLVNMSGEVVGLISHQMRSGQNLNFAIPVARLKELLAGAQQPVDVSTLRAPLLTQIGALPPESRRRTVEIPGTTPHTLAFSTWQKWDESSVQATCGGSSLVRVGGRAELRAGTFCVSGGVIEFHAEQKGMKVELEAEVTPFRVAVLVTRDTTEQLQAVLNERLTALGDEVLTGAEVQAAVGEWAPQAEQLADFRQLAQRLNCSRLLVARCWGMKGAGAFALRKATQLTVAIEVYDLNTGRRVLSAEGNGAADRMGGSWGSLFSDAQRQALDSLMKGW